jgi:proteasome lid subunit RPN8/RPN11
MYLNKVIINKEAKDLMEKHVTWGIPNEVGGYLLGLPCTCQSQNMTWVVKAIPGRCNSSRYYVEIESSTYDTVWHYVEKENLAVVGWYHSHPNLGIFFSSIDRRNSKLYFRKPHQVAIVIDPVRDLKGIYGWTNHEAHTLDLVDSTVFIGNDHKKYFLNNR